MITLAAKWIATGFGSGLLPRGPGTSGSLAALLLWTAVQLSFPDNSYLINILCIAVSVLVGLWGAHVYLGSPRVHGRGRHDDPGEVVIDEWAGMFVSLSFVAPTSVAGIICAFVFFRLFDIIKPYPVSRLEKLPGAVGIMADDLMAGLLAGLCAFAGLMLYGLF